MTHVLLYTSTKVHAPHTHIIKHAHRNGQTGTHTRPLTYIYLFGDQPTTSLSHTYTPPHTQAQIPTHTHNTHTYTHIDTDNHIHTHSETLQPPARNLLELSSLEIEGQGIGPPHPQLAEKMKRAMAVLFGTDA